jgi:hypothetical protein
MCQPLETPDNNYSRGEPEHAGLVDDVPPAASDWAHMARAASDAPGWQAAAEYNKNHQSAAKIELQRLRYLTGNYVSASTVVAAASPRRRWSFSSDHARFSVVFSIAVQSGADVESIRKALCRDGHGRASGPLGAALDLLAEGERRP